MKQSNLVAAAFLGLALAGCASSGGLSGADRLALYRSHAGEPVNSFHFNGSFLGWTELGDSALALQTRPTESWLIELSGPCPGLEHSMGIGLTSRMNQVSIRFDKVLVRDGIPGGCPIATIRPLDVKALKADIRKLREASAAERPDEGGNG